MKYLHTMVRVTDVDASLRFYRDALGLEEIRRTENEKGRYTLIFLAPPGQHDTPVDLIRHLALIVRRRPLASISTLENAC